MFVCKVLEVVKCLQVKFLANEGLLFCKQSSCVCMHSNMFMDLRMTTKDNQYKCVILNIYHMKFHLVFDVYDVCVIYNCNFLQHGYVF